MRRSILQAHADVLILNGFFAAEGERSHFIGVLVKPENRFRNARKKIAELSQND
jgi:hypothetical protein